MEHTPFEYGGLHFIPERRFEPQGQYHCEDGLRPYDERSAPESRQEYER